MRALALLAALALGYCGDDPAGETALGVVGDASIDIVVCNSNYQRRLTFTLAARADVSCVEATIEGLPFGDGEVMPMNATVPDGFTFVVRCVDTLQMPGGMRSIEASGRAHVDIELAAGGTRATASVAAPFSGGMQAFDNCGNLLAPDGCTLRDP